MLNFVTTFQRLPRDIRLYSWAWGLLGFGYFGIFGVLLNLYLLRLGYGPETIGMLVGIGQLVWGITAIPAGLLGGRIGNRNAMIWGIGILVVNTALLLCVELLPSTLQFGWIALWWCTSWIGSSLMIVNGTPYIMAVSAPEDRSHVFMIQQIFLGFFGFAGSLLAGLLPTFFANLTGTEPDTAIVYWYALWMAPLSYLTALLLIRRTMPLPPITMKSESHTRAAIPLFAIIFMGLIIFLQVTGEGTIRAFFNIYLDTQLQMPISLIGIVIGLGQFLPILSVLAAPFLIARWGASSTIIITGVTSSLLMLVLAFVATWFGASVSYISFLLVISISVVARSLYSQELVAPQWRTLMSASYTIGLALGWASAAILGGYLIRAIGYGGVFSLGAVMSFGSALLLWLYVRTGARGAAKAPASLHSAP